MNEKPEHDKKRRALLKLAGALGISGLATPILGSSERPVGAMIPGKGWVAAGNESRPGDGSFIEARSKREISSSYVAQSGQ